MSAGQAADGVQVEFRAPGAGVRAFPAGFFVIAGRRDKVLAGPFKTEREAEGAARQGRRA